MIVGHLALAVTAKRSVPALSLGWLVAASMAADLLWPIFLLTGLETVQIAPGATAFTPLVFLSYPWTHSLLMLLLWGVALALVARSRGVAGKALPLLAALVASHWLLDSFMHEPDLPLWPGASTGFGLGLWRSIPGTLLLEGGAWVAALVFYLRARPLRGRGARLAFWSFVLFATVIWASSPWAPLPPSVRALSVFGLVGWLLIPWAAAADRRPQTSA